MLRPSEVELRFHGTASPRLSEPEIRNALRVNANNPLWLAVHQLIEQPVKEAKWQPEEFDRLHAATYRHSTLGD